MVTVPEIVPPSAGEVMLTAGGVRSLLVVMVTPAELPTFPAASYARAVSTWLALETVAESQEMLNGEAGSEPANAPSTYNSTRVTPYRSEADIETAITPVTTAPEAGEVMLTEGGVVSM